MILEVDAAQLEWRVAAELSRDAVMIEEICNGVDQHQATLDEVFGGQATRTDAKVFNFRMIYKTSAYGLFKDPRMPSFSQQKYQEMINRFNQKYCGLIDWQQANIGKVFRAGELINPNGRILKFRRIKRRDGSMGYNLSQIANYPVQSFAYDLVSLATVVTRKQLKKHNICMKQFPYRSPLINLVHDSNVYDHNKERRIAEICINVFRNIPKFVKQYFNYDMAVPIDADAKVGYSWGEMEEFKI